MILSGEHGLSTQLHFPHDSKLKFVKGLKLIFFNGEVFWIILRNVHKPLKTFKSPQTCLRSHKIAM
jgi:hypothetical protein